MSPLEGGGYSGTSMEMSLAVKLLQENIVSKAMLNLQPEEEDTM